MDSGCTSVASFLALSLMLTSARSVENIMPGVSELEDASDKEAYAISKFQSVVTSEGEKKRHFCWDKYVCLADFLLDTRRL